MTLKELRKNNNLTYREVAEIIPCETSTYFKYENEKRSIPYSTVEKLAAFYAVSPSEIAKDQQNIKIQPKKNKDSENPVSDSIVLSDTELEVIYAFRDADSRAQSDALKILKSHVER